MPIHDSVYDVMNDRSRIGYQRSGGRASIGRWRRPPMSTLTIRLPDSTAERLKILARTRGISVNKLVEEMSTQAIAAFDAETRFRTLATKGDRARALAILERLDQLER